MGNETKISEEQLREFVGTHSTAGVLHQMARELLARRAADAVAVELVEAVREFGSYFDWNEPMLTSTAITVENPDGINAAMARVWAALARWEAR